MADRGIFITFEGADGVGKSTHVNFFNEVLSAFGHKTLLIREPGGTEISEQIREILLATDNTHMTDRTELLLYEAARAQIVAEKIEPALMAGRIVICDRFYDSTLAYQGFGRGLDREMITKLNDFATNGLVPDRTILFTVSEEERLRRVGKRDETDRLEAEAEEFKRSVRDGFLKLQVSASERIKIVDTSKAHSQTALSIIEEVGDLIEIDASSRILKEMLVSLDEAHRH